MSQNGASLRPFRLPSSSSSSFVFIWIGRTVTHHFHDGRTLRFVFHFPIYIFALIYVCIDVWQEESVRCVCGWVRDRIRRIRCGLKVFGSFSMRILLVKFSENVSLRWEERKRAGWSSVVLYHFVMWLNGQTQASIRYENALFFTFIFWILSNIECDSFVKQFHPSEQNSWDFQNI